MHTLQKSEHWAATLPIEVPIHTTTGISPETLATDHALNNLHMTRPHRARLTAIFVPKLQRLPADAISHIVGLWAHTGYY